MRGEDFKSAFLQSVFQEQVDRHQEYQRLDEAAKARISEIDAELHRIESELNRIIAAIPARGSKKVLGRGKQAAGRLAPGLSVRIKYQI